MSFIHYEASVHDQAGKERDFNISWPVDNVVVESLQAAIDDSGNNNKSKISATGMAKAKDVVGKTLIGAHPYIMEAAPWTCKCGRRATEIHHSPLMEESKIKQGIVVDKPEMICDNPKCKERALHAKLQELKEEKKKGYKMSCMYTCASCEKTGGAKEMKKCPICLMSWYCSNRDCQQAHLRSSHQQEP